MSNSVAGIAILMIVGLVVSISAAQEWHIVIVDEEGNVGYLSSIALNSSNYPHISHRDTANYDLKYSYWTGSAWINQTVDSAGDVGWYTSIALDSQDYPHITYYDSTNKNIKYAHWTGSSWDINIVDSSGSDTNEWSSIEIDNQDHHHISYYDRTYKNLKYAYWTGSSWTKQTIDSTGDVGKYTSIALDSQFRPHISYRDSTNQDLKYTRWTGSIWEKQTVDSSGDVGWYTSIAIDSQDRPNITCYDYTNRNLNYYWWTGTSWDIQIIDSTGDVGECSSIAIDNQDHPHIAYSNNSDLKYAHWNGSAWEIQILDSAGNVGWDNSITLDSQDRPYISYYDATNGDLKLAWYGYPLNVELFSFSAQPSHSEITLTWSVETTEDEEILGFNLYRRELPAEASSLGDVAHHAIKDDCIKINPGLITGENPYSYTETTVESGVAYEYKLEAVLADDSPETLGTTQATAGQPTSFAILSLYPNPASYYLTCLLALPSAGVVELTLYDLSGRLVLKQQLEATEPTELEAILDVSGLASGVYTLQASSGGDEVSPACGGVAVVVR